MVWSSALRRRAQDRAFTLIEALVYIGALAILLGVGYLALYRCMNNSLALRRSAGDIADVLHAGESWRADVRAAGPRVQIETNSAVPVLWLPGAQGRVSYCFATNTVFRRFGTNAWLPVLGNVKASEFMLDTRHGVKTLAWELELQTRRKKISSLRPLFTFIAVPGADSKP